ncbi:MAG: winged helix-turn-helix domain-containing protein [Acidobacteriota bacterium]|nr:winged helix-turn-helix domain-containing protein [Acidobacteriota bacterium]
MKESAARRYAFGQFQVDLAERLLTQSGSPLPLPPKAFDLLALFVENPGRLLEKDRIMQELWPDTFVEEANLANLIGLLRRTLGDSSSNSRYIQTVPKRGYRFVATVLESDPASPRPPVRVEEPERAAIRIIVLPFQTESGGGEADYLANGLPEALAASLSELNLFTVRSTQLARRFDGVAWNPKTLAIEADVDVIVAGTLARSGDHIHATTELIDAPNGAVLWSRVWDLQASELFRLHNGVVQLVVRCLLRRTREADSSMPTVDSPSVSGAYELYLRANHLSSKRSFENMALARELYIACTQMDPNYASAWAGLGRCTRWIEKFGPPSAVSNGAAEEAFQRAFRLDPGHPVAHSAYTALQCDGGSAEDALLRLTRIAASRQNNPQFFAGLVHACRYCGLLEASIAAHERVRCLDKHFPTSVAHSYFAMADYDRALYWYDQNTGLYLDTAALASAGRLKEASDLLWTRCDRVGSLSALMASLQAYIDGDPERGLTILRKELSSTPCDPEIRFYMARQAGRFGDIELTLTLLQKSVEGGYWCSPALLRDPWLESVRGLSEFEALRSTVQQRELRARRRFAEAGGEGLFSVPGAASVRLAAH